MVHLFTYLILWYWTHSKSSIRGVTYCVFFFSFCNFQYDVRVGLIYYLFPEHIWLATLSKRNKIDLLEPQIPWRFGRILVVSSGESCACVFFPKSFAFRALSKYFFSRLFSFFFNCHFPLPSACYFSAFCWWHEQRAGHTDIQSMAFFQQNSTFFPFPRAQFTYVQHFPIGSMYTVYGILTFTINPNS